MHLANAASFKGGDVLCDRHLCSASHPARNTSALETQQRLRSREKSCIMFLLGLKPWTTPYRLVPTLADTLSKLLLAEHFHVLSAFLYSCWLAQMQFADVDFLSAGDLQSSKGNKSMRSTRSILKTLQSMPDTKVSSPQKGSYHAS